MRNELLEVMTSRRSKILKVTLDIFNKIQEQKVPTFKLNDIETVANREQGTQGLEENLDELMQKFEILLDNPRSPLISALKHLAQYKGDKGVTNFTKLYSEIEGIIHNPLDLQKLTKENHQLESIT